jgi:hypothetical protein
VEPVVLVVLVVILRKLSPLAPLGNIIERTSVILACVFEGEMFQLQTPNRTWH